MSMDTFLQLEVMLPHEEMLEKGPSRPPKTTQHPFLSRLGLCGARFYRHRSISGHSIAAERAFKSSLRATAGGKGPAIRFPKTDALLAGLIYEWTPPLGDRVFFLSHQWTSFAHPDPLGEQLRCAQTAFTTIREGGLRTLFKTNHEWLNFNRKEARLPTSSPRSLARSPDPSQSSSALPRAVGATAHNVFADERPFATITFKKIPLEQNGNTQDKTCRNRIENTCL